MTNTETMLEDCLSAKTCSNSPFNDWEDEFLENVSEQFSYGKYLTEKQIETLKKCWDKI